MSKGSSLGRDYNRFFSAGLASNLGDGISLIVYPWLAAILTRDPVLIGLTLAIWRAPWLLFSLPIGVLLDRMNRFDLMVQANSARAALAVLVAVLFELQLMGIWGFYGCVFVLGSCTVLHQIAAETVVPSLVDTRHLEHAYGRLWSAELLANQFGGPLLAGALIGGLIVVPLTASAAATAAAVLLLSQVSNRSTAPAPLRPSHMGRHIKEALVYLRQNRRLRTLALTLAVLNPVIAMVQATFLLYVQEVLSGGSLTYGALVAAGGVGGVAGGLCARKVSQRVPIGVILCSFFYIAAAVNVGTALVPVAVFVGMVTFAFNFAVVVWNVVGRSSRQRIMSDDMRGRVTSAIRWLGWGLLPVGFLAGGLIVKIFEPIVGRDWALRTPMLAGAALFVLIGAVAGPRLTTRRMTASDDQRATMLAPPRPA